MGPSSEGPIRSKRFTIHIYSTPTFLYFDLYLQNTAYTQHVYFTEWIVMDNSKIQYVYPIYDIV